MPLLIGGNGRRLLRYAATHADIVGLSGLGRTLEDGHQHEVRWTADQIAASVGHVRDAADRAGRSPELEALVQHVEITDDAGAAARRFADEVEGLTPDQALAAPFVWIGTAEEIAGRLRGHRERFGITRYVVRAAAVEAAAQVLASQPPPGASPA